MFICHRRALSQVYLIYRWNVHVCTALVFVLHWWRDCTCSSPFACWHFIHCDHVTFKSLSDMHEHRAPWFHGQFSSEAMLSTCHPDREWWWKFVARCRSWCKPVESVIEFCPPVHPLFCSLAVLNPRVGHTMDVLSPFISVLCHSDWLFHGQSCPRFDVVHPGRAWSSSPACTWHCSLHYLFLQATPLFPHASFLALTVSNSSLFTPALLRTHSFVFFAAH